MEGRRLGPYQVLAELGSGGMGTVYRAEVAEKAAGLEPGASVALKVVHPHLLETPGFFKRFMREAQLGQSIRHENVVQTLDCDQEFAGSKPQCFLVMEYVEGQTLAQLLSELERVPEELCRHVAREICKGLSAIHDAGIVHRDVKPENVLITPDNVVKAMDLGVARLTDEAIRLSKSGAFVGSVEYAAPEQFKGGDVDGRTDLHALGLVLYELASGAHPYRGGAFHEVLGRICNEAPRRLGEINPQLSAFFEEVVHTLLVKDPRGRFASAAQLLDVLQDGEDSTWWHERARSLQEETKLPIRRIRIPRETAVYGRDAELAKLRGLYDRASSGDGQVVLIEGEAGIGKSRLVDELVGRLHADGEDLNFLFGSYPPGGAATAAGGFSSAYREHFGEPGSAEYLTEAPLLVPAFDALLRGEPAPTGVVGLTSDSLGTCFVHATRGLAAERPTVILIDDLHFAPEEARTLFTALAQAVPGHRVLLIGTMRPSVSEDWAANVSRLDHVARMEVPRIGPKDLGLLLEDSFKSSELAHALGMQIAMKSDGNPFFAFEIIRGLREGQFITKQDDGTWASTQIIDEIQIPSSVLDLVNARVGDLTEEERDLLDVACCWGYEFDPGLVGDVLGMPRIPLLKRFGQIERKHRLVRAAGRHMVFDHHQVQEALYGSLLEQLREEYHGALAEALEVRTKAAEQDAETLDGALCVDLCEHYLAGARGENAVRYLDAAQAHLSKGYLNAQMLSLTERALAVPGLLNGKVRTRALLRLAEALDRMGRRARQEEVAREAQHLADETGDERLRLEAMMEVGHFLQRTGRHGEAEIKFQRALDMARAKGDKQAEILATGNLASVFQSLGRLREAGEHMERQLVLSREIGERRLEAGAHGNLGTVFLSRGRLREAEEHMERQLALSREIEDMEGVARATGNLGGVYFREHRLPEARERWERSLALSREIGLRSSEAADTVNLGILFSSDERVSEAREYFERGMALSHELGYRKAEAAAAANLGALSHSIGRIAEARKYYERRLAIGRDTRDRESEAQALVDLGNTLRSSRESAASEASYVASLDVSAESELRQVEARAHLGLGSLRAALSRADGSGGEGGRASLLAARDLSVEFGLPELETLARCELALLPGGDAEDACAALAGYEEQLRPSIHRSARLLLWQATGDRAHLEEAKRLLDETLAKIPKEHHEEMLTNVPLNREILEAWAEHGEQVDT